MIKIISSTFLMVFILVQSVSAALPPSWKKEIQFDLEREERDVLTAVSLDAEVYRKSQNNFADLRILNAEGDDVSYKLIEESDTRRQTQEQRWSPQEVSLSPSDEQLEIGFTLKEDDPAPTQLKIVTPLQNFEQRIRVYGVGKANERLLADDAIFDYTRYMDIRRTEVSFPETEFRRFRVVIDNPTSKQESRLKQLTRQLHGDDETGRQERIIIERRPFRIDRLQLVSTVERYVPDQRLVTDWNLTIKQQENDDETGLTLIEFETRRQPLTQITLKTDSRNFSRRVRIERPNQKTGRTTWETLAEGQVSQFSFGDYEQADFTLKFPETRQRKLRLVIENRDSSPLNVRGLAAAGHRHQLLFLAHGDQSYELHYGSHAETPPNYDTAAIDLMQSQGVNPFIAELGPEIQLSEDAGAEPGRFKKIINNPIVLGSIIFVITLLLGWSLYQATRKLNESTPNDD
ncbi:MAG: DUF3999 family protein [Planctomycetaceae bacterium]|nr:DUF3999 family protein [Planctomycetaceae bacterium]